MQTKEKTKRLLLSVPVLLLLACLLTACAPQPPAPEEEPEPDPRALYFGGSEEFADATGRVYSSFRVTVGDDFYQPLSPAQIELLSPALETLARDFIDNRQAEDAALLDGDPDYEATHQLELTLFCAEADFVSVQGEQYDYVQGAAHPQISYRGYVWDGSGERLTLERVQGADFPQRAVESILSQIEGRGETDNYFPDLEILLEQAMGEGKWYMDREQVYLLYDPYEIAPYALGPQVFPVKKE